MKDILKVGDIMIMDGRAYVSMEMHSNLIKDLKIANDIATNLTERLNSIEVANANRKQMRILNNQVYDTKK